MSILLVMSVLPYLGNCQASNADSLQSKALMVIDGDSLKKQVLQKKDEAAFKIDPKVATRRSAILPGAGQLYIKQYWFLPAIYGGFVVNTVFVSKWQKNYKLFKNEYFKISKHNDNLPVGDTKLSKGKVIINGVEKEYSVDVLKQGTNIYRRYRDLTLMVYPLIWAVNIIEVNVSAHLKTFDMTDNISMQLKPTMELGPTLTPVLAAKAVFTFK
jgi:hypothetical protein